MSDLEKINHSALKILVEANAVNKITAFAYADKWSLQISCGNNKIIKTVVAKNSGKTRVWRKLDTLAKYLLDLGVYQFETDVTKYDPSKQTLRRPDSAAALKRTHQAHKKLNEQVVAQKPDAVMLKTVSKNDLSANQVRENWEKRRAKILQEANPRAR
jgi:hypothetical protein